MTSGRFGTTGTAFLGTIHEKGGLLASIHYFDETPHQVLLDTDALMIGVRMNPVVSTGDPTAFYGTQWHDETTC